ncbi:hypothetical protein [Deinococcus marmoris]|uniref:hypothetical protein n=1 Tax=Deinococcus marmoris TaxID=249408 RepID=UPI000494ED5F|nr:hypothetical protein [Deinococcus marmoris]
MTCPETPQAFLVWMAWEQRQEMFRQAGWDYLHEISEEICAHPNANAEVFGVLIDDDVFQEQDTDYGLPCAHLISEHPGASDRQKEAALRQIKFVEQEDEE